MAVEVNKNASQIVLPAPVPPVQNPPSRYVPPRPLPKRFQGWAPAWFYSALSWLGKSYYDASNNLQRFAPVLVGSDVDPYSEIGSTRLFMISRIENLFRLTLAPDVNSTAPTFGGTRYPDTDEGIRQMYVDLSASPVFAAVKRCYIPGQIGVDLNPNLVSIGTGYDPATGLRAIVLGSAVSQIVPLDDFLQAHNQQIYNEQPVIVPLVSALVYDVTQYNTVGATTFVLPVYYAKDQVSAGNYYVSKFDSVTAVNGANVHYGQSVVFPGGPGYNDATATALALKSTIAVSSPGGPTFTTYTFDKAIVVTISTFSPRVDAGIMSLTCTAASLASAFANQQIIGFYRDPAWSTCLGVPIYDFGASNGEFQPAAVTLNPPTLIYDPSHPFLNGGSLQNVTRKLAAATYLYSPDKLVSLLNTAIAAQTNDSGAGPSVMAATLNFNMSSTPGGPIVDQLAVPVLVTVTTTPSVPSRRPDTAVSGAKAVAGSAAAVPTPKAVAPGTISISGGAGSNLNQIIGGGANLPIHPQPAPVTIQVGLTASIPREALSGTGISTVEIGTNFQQQNLGSGAAFEAVSATVVNLMARDNPALAPYSLAIASAGVTFTAGVSYILSLTGTNLSVRGSDGSTASSVLTSTSDPNHTYVGAMVYSTGISSVLLYPKLQLTLAAPAVGTHGVLQGTVYSVRLTIGDGNSQYDILDPAQTIVDSNITVPTPQPAGKSTPQSGDLYFGSFIGGASQMTLWLVPVFLTVGSSQLPGASFNGSMTLGVQASGLPEYRLQITDNSLFVFSNINVDTDSVGSLSSANVFLASAVMNSAPDDTSSKAFAPCRLVMGLVRQAQMGAMLDYVFVPEDDSIVIGGTRYMVSIVNLEAMGFDPNSLPYPPVFWPSQQFWQFANRHNPYLGVRYTGADQESRVKQAQADTATIGLQTAQAQEPMQLYLEATTGGMTIWPIYAFPYANQIVDFGQLKEIVATILGLLNVQASTGSTGAGVGGTALIDVPGALHQANPFTAETATSVAVQSAVNSSITAVTREPVISGVQVTNLNPGFIANTSIQGMAARQSLAQMRVQQNAVDLATTKNLAPVVAVTQSSAAAVTGTTASFGVQHHQPIYGFTVYNPGTGEAYIIELVGSDLTPPDQLPNPTRNATYDPYYVRVVFLNTLTCYNMSIIVPTMVYDQYGHFAKEGTLYQNVLGQTNELGLGYMYSLYDSANNFDTLTFSSLLQFTAVASASGAYLYSNYPYSLAQTSSFSPVSLFGQFSTSFLTGAPAAEVTLFAEATRNPAIKGNTVAFDTSLINYTVPSTPPAYFVCRRQNWSADSHLMQATHPDGTARYLAFGAGDIVPFRLDAPFETDKRLPAHMNRLTYTFADQTYDAAKTISVANQPYFVAVTTNNGVTQYMNFSINATAGTADLQISSNQRLRFPTDCYVVGQSSTTLTSISDINKLANTSLVDTGDFVNFDNQNHVSKHQEFQLIAYNNLVYLVRAVSNVAALGYVGGLGAVSGLLVDTFVPTKTGNLARAQAARYKRSGLSFFGSSYTSTTMIDSLDTLDFTGITGETFYQPTIFIPIPDLDASKGFVADLSNFIGQQIWTLIYPEIVAEPGATVGGVSYPNGHNLDSTNKPILSVQKLHFVYDPLAVMFTPNDLTHKYPLVPKQQILALTNGQIQEGICWRSANVQPQRNPPTNICAQEILPAGNGMDRPNIIYSPQNTGVITPISNDYKGMSVHRIRSLTGVVYNIEESALSSALTNDQAGASFISAVSSVANMLVGVLFDYDNNDLGTLDPYNPKESTKGVVLINGYLGASGYAFSSPDHFDVNDVLRSQVPLLDQIANVLGWEVALYDTDPSLPRQFWSMTYDSATAPGLPNFIPDIPPSVADPAFTNRTRSLVLSIENPVRPRQLGLMDTYSSVVSANLHLQNGVTGSVFLSKKADRDVVSIGTNPAGPNSLYGLPAKYDFFIFSRDHYGTLKGATFELIDQGYAMCLVDDGTGTNSKVAKYNIDQDGNYYELFTYALSTPTAGIIEQASFTLKVTLGSPANLSASPVIPETPNNVNPQDLVAQINKVSNLVYAAFGPSSPGQPPAYIPVQAVLPLNSSGQPQSGGPQAAPISGAPGFNGYTLNVLGANRQPVQISQIFSGATAYPIAGSTTIVPYNPGSAKSVPFFGSLSHGLDQLHSSLAPMAGVFGGNGLGGLIATPFSLAFQGVAPIPASGAVMKGDNSVFYTLNAVANTVMDSTGKSATAAGGQYFIDTTDPANPITGVVTLPKFTFNGNSYTFNLSTTLSDGSTSRYTLIVGGRSYQFGADNAHVTVDRTVFTFNPVKNGSYTVTYADKDDPTGSEAPIPIPLSPFSIAVGGQSKAIDVFTRPGDLANISLGVIGRLYAYDPVGGTATVTAGAKNTKVSVQTGLVFVSSSNYGYVIGLAGGYTINGSPMLRYSASPSQAPPTYALMTSPQMFTLGGNFYTFDQDANGNYVSVTGNSQTYPVNPYQFSINGAIYIINTNVQPNTVIGGGNIYPMTAGNSQFIVNGVQYTITLKQGSLNGATVSGQFNITQGNVVVIENYVYQLDTLNGQIVGNGTTYPLTTSGFTYTITTADRSFTVTTERNATTVTIGNIVYLINNTTVVGDSVIYPILTYRTFVDGSNKFVVGIDGTVSAGTFTLSGSSPWVRSTFTDGTATYTVNDEAASDGTSYYLISGSPAQFKTATLTYTIRTDGIAIAAGASKTYIINPAGPPSPNRFTFGTETIYFGRPVDFAAFDGVKYYAIVNGEFTDSTRSLTFTLSGNTAVNAGNSYEIFSNLGQTPYFQVPGGATYYINIPVADTGTASNDIYNVFPVSGGQFTIPLVYTVTASGGIVTVNAVTFTGGATVVPTLTATGAGLTGGYFQDPVTKIVYTCVVDGAQISFVDSNNSAYAYPSAAGPNTFVASVVVATGVSLALDGNSPPDIYPIAGNQFVTSTAKYTINVPVAYQNASTGPYWQMVNGRFIVPRAGPLSNIAYTVKGATVTKGYPTNGDDEFSADGNVVYTVNAVNIVRASNQAILSGAAPNQTLTYGTAKYTLNSTTAVASIQPSGLTYNSGTKQFSVSYNGSAVTYTVGATSVTDNRRSAGSFPAIVGGTQITFTDTISGVTFTFDSSGNNPVTAEFAYTNQFFIDPISGVTFYIDATANKVEAISYLPETTQYAFVPADGNTYLIHYNDVSVVFPVISGAGVSAGVATVGSDIFTVHVDEVVPAGGGAAVPVNLNSFEINGNLYTISGTPVGANYASCQVVGDAITPKPFISPNTFKLTDPNIVYTLQLDANDLPTGVVATFPVRTSADLINVNDDVYIITYNTTTTGSLLGQGQGSIAISNSGFALTNPFDSTKTNFIFADLDIYDAASVIGQFTVYLAPTFFIGTSTFTLDPVRLAVSDNNKVPYPLLPNPMMFSINGFNYVLDTNRVPHAVIGNNNVSPLATDVTVESGEPVPNSTFTLNGLIYRLTEDASHNLLAITGTKSYPIAAPGSAFKLDSTLVFTLSAGIGGHVGSAVPIGSVTSGTTTLNLYAGTPESGNADYFMYKNVLYTLVKSGSNYLAVQKSYTVYVAKPVTNQQQLAVFDLNGSTYLVTDGTTAGTTPAAGINPGTMWAQTATSGAEAQFGQVYGFTAQPINVTQSAIPPQNFQFQVTDASGNTTLYDILYTPGGTTNVVTVDVPDLLPTFTQSPAFGFVTSYPLTFETGGYNAFTTSVAETAAPIESFAGAYRTPVVSTDNGIDNLITAQGDFSLEFWHSLPLTGPTAYHPATYSASSKDPLVYYVDIDFETTSKIFIGINGSVLRTDTTPPVPSSGWQHFALTYQQPYVMLFDRKGSSTTDTGAAFEVKSGTNYNFSRDFSIAMTFSCTDVTSLQGLLYKGTAADVTSPALALSYRVGIEDSAVVLWVAEGNFPAHGAQAVSKFVSDAVLKTDTFYQIVIVKQTSTPAGNTSDTSPFAPPLGFKDLGDAASAGGTADTSKFQPGSSSSTISGFQPASPSGGGTTGLQNIINTLGALPSAGATPQQSYTVTISIREVHDDGTFGKWDSLTPSPRTVSDDSGLWVNSTGSSHLLIGTAFDDTGQPMPMGGPSGVGNVRDVYLFNAAIDTTGIKTRSGIIDIGSATSNDLLSAGIVGFWRAAYDPNGVVNNPFDQNAVAISTNSSRAHLAALKHRELEATSLYIDGFPMSLVLVTGPDVPPSMSSGYSGGPSLIFNAGVYKLEEISVWQMVRQPYQIIDDMFGRLVPSNEPFLAIYLSGEFDLSSLNPPPTALAPYLPVGSYIDNVTVSNAASLALTFSPASLDLAGSPAVARCGPLITPNLYTPPGVALTVADTVPELTTYSITLNGVTGSLAGEINEAYVYIRNNVLTLYAGKKIGDLVLSWVSQEQGDVQVIGYIEGAPPCPMANLTNKPATTYLEPTTVYPGATAITLTAPTSVSVKYENGEDSSSETSWTLVDNLLGFKFSLALNVSPFGFGIHSPALAVDLKVKPPSVTFSSGSGEGWDQTAALKLDESVKCTVKLEGTLAPYTNDQFMANLNTLTTPSATPGNPSTKTAILPNPNLGGFTASNPPSPIPKAPADEKFGARMFMPSPYGTAFVTSKTLDVYQQTLVQTNTVYGFVKVPDPQIPPDFNIVNFRMSSKYIRPGCLDGVIGYVYNPATLPTGVQTYATSTGQMEVLYDMNFAPGQVGHEASYMRVVEAYRLKKQIDQETFNAIALYQTAYNAQGSPTDPSLVPALDFYNEYVWSSRGGTQEIKHTWATSYDEVYSANTFSTSSLTMNFNVKLHIFGATVLDLDLKFKETMKDKIRYKYTASSKSSFDVTASFDGIEPDTQMRYAANNDAHFVMNFNSMFNPNNQSGLNLVIGSDGLVYNVVPSVASGAGRPVSDNIDTGMTYSQPQPSYTSGNADGLTGNLEPYDRPGKVKTFRTYAFFMQPAQQNADDFWNTVVDPVWLKYSPDSDAVALRAASHSSVPWRLLHRVTFVDRFLPPISTEAVVVPRITPVIAVPVTNQPSDFLFQDITVLPRPAHNPGNDTEANVVLVMPTSSGLSAGSKPTTGPNAGKTILPNNVIPFDIAKTFTSIVNWGDTANARLLSQLTMSALGLNVLPMSATLLPGSTKVTDVLDPVSGEPLYSVYIDPNGLTQNVSRTFGITVYQDVNGNPIQYYDGKTYHSLQADFVATPDGTVTYFIQPPSTYDQSAFDLLGDYDLFGHPGDQWRYYLVSGMSANMTSEASVKGLGPFLASTGMAPYTGLTIASSQHAGDGSVQVGGYVLVQCFLQWPQLNTNAETFADVQVYKSMSLLDTFPIGDPDVLVDFLETQYPGAAFVASDSQNLKRPGNQEISLVFAKNIVSYFNTVQQALLPT